MLRHNSVKEFLNPCRELRIADLWLKQEGDHQKWQGNQHLLRQLAQGCFEHRGIPVLTLLCETDGWNRQRNGFRAGALQKVQKLMTGDDRKLSAWREVQSFEDRISARMEELSRMLETAIAADKNDPGGIDDQILASTLQTDRVFEQTILSLIRLSNQQATALAVLPRTGKFAMLQWQIDNTVHAAEDWRRQWSNIIADEEDLSTRITTP